MKQVIVLCASIMLGIFIWLQICGSGGIADNITGLWQYERNIRNMQVIQP